MVWATATRSILGLGPFDRDTDDDGIEDGREVGVVGTAADTADTDGDGFGDAYEDRNRDSKGLDPLVADVKVSTASYATDFAIGAVAGDAWRKDSFAWLAGSLASTGASSVPIVGWVVGPLTDARDAIASAIRGDWVSAGFSAVGVVPYAGDAIAIPGKAAKFVARNPEAATTVAAAIMAINKVPERIKVQAAKGIWANWDDLRAAGYSEKALLQLSKGKTNLDDLAGAISRPKHVHGAPAKFFADGPEGERHLQELLGAKGTAVNTQVVASTAQCIQLCNMAYRRFDVVVDGIAHEAKVGYRPWSDTIAKQIRSDAYLIQTGVIEGAHWDFFASAYNDKMGASPRVLDLLDEVGVPYTFHLPASR